MDDGVTANIVGAMRAGFSGVCVSDIRRRWCSGCCRISIAATSVGPAVAFSVVVAFGKPDKLAELMNVASGEVPKISAVGDAIRIKPKPFSISGFVVSANGWVYETFKYIIFYKHIFSLNVFFK